MKYREGELTDQNLKPDGSGMFGGGFKKRVKPIRYDARRSTPVEVEEADPPKRHFLAFSRTCFFEGTEGTDNG